VSEYAPSHAASANPLREPELGHARMTGNRSIRKHAALALALVRSAGEPALVRALPLYVGIAMAAAVIFGPTGMDAADVTDAVSASRGFRIGLWAAWLAAMLGPARALFGAQKSFYLRSFPIAPAVHHLVLGLVLALLHAPWVYLFARGAGALPAVGALAMAVALTALLSARPRSLADAALGALIAGGAAVVLALPAPVWAHVAYGGAVAVLAVPGAWWRAPEAGPGWGVVRVRGSWFSALVRAHLAALWRERQAVFGRAGIAALVGAGFAALTARANEASAGAELAVFSLAIGAVSLSVVAGSFAVAVLESERSARWLLDAAAASGVRRAAASSALVAALGAVCGGLHGAVAAWGAGADAMSWARVCGEGIGCGAALSLVAIWLARTAERAPGVDGARLVACSTGVAALCAIGFGAFGEIVLALLGALAVALAIRTADMAAFPARHWDATPRVGG